MSIEAIIGIGAAVVGAGVWFRLGQITGFVEDADRRLTRIETTIMEIFK